MAHVISAPSFLPEDVVPDVDAVARAVSFMVPGNETDPPTGITALLPLTVIAISVKVLFLYSIVEN